jgi:hypothetical protein
VQHAKKAKYIPQNKEKVWLVRRVALIRYARYNSLKSLVLHYNIVEIETFISRKE